jgi:glutamate formiminotransferase
LRTFTVLERRLWAVFPLEAVPNFSEGRDRLTIEAIGEALADGARLLDVHSDADHNRSVYTLVGSEEELVVSLLGGIETARERIDLRRQEGAHPRIGAADVVPIVAIREADRERAEATAVELARRVGEDLGLPVFLYGNLTPGLGPAFFRRGGTAELQRRLDAGELTPDFGPTRLDERAGGVLVGSRPPLIAFNVNLAGDDLEAAQEVARAVRERDGGFPGVRALGLRLPQAGHVQVSLNIEDWRVAPLHEVVAAVEREARARGLRVTGSELVGLLPAGAAVAAARSLLRVAHLDPTHVLELRLLDDQGA